MIGFIDGRAIAQAVSRWLPTAATQVRARVWQVVFVVDKVELGQVSPDNLHSTKFSIITITRGRFNRPVVADVPSGPNTDSTPTMRIKKKGFMDTVWKNM
jgi:hypothetical protein